MPAGLYGLANSIPSTKGVNYTPYLVHTVVYVPPRTRADQLQPCSLSHDIYDKHRHRIIGFVLSGVQAGTLGFIKLTTRKANRVHACPNLDAIRG